MVVVTFVLAIGLLVGVVGVRAGITAAAAAIVAGASAAVLLDAASLLGRPSLEAPRAAPSGRPSSARAAAGPCGALDDVLWLMLRDTFEVSLVVIAVVGGLTYALLATLAAVAHVLSG
jgi:hypothetical protein